LVHNLRELAKSTRSRRLLGEIPLNSPSSIHSFLNIYPLSHHFLNNLLPGILSDK
jgi:hypothetical protein